MTLDRTISAELLALDNAYLNIISTGQDLADFVTRCRVFFERVEAYMAGDGISAQVVAHLASFALRVKTISDGLGIVEQRCWEIERHAVHSVRNYFGQASLEATVQSKNLDAQLDHSPYRDYFLSHLGSPYPVGDDRDHLLSLIPSHDRAQLDNWFSNARRRSGWTAFRRDFAFDSPLVLQNLLDNIDAVGNEEAKARLEGVKRYFDPERELEVAEPLRELVQQGPKFATPPKTTTTRAEERLAKRASRGVGSQTGDARRLPNSNGESWSPRRRQRNPSSGAFSTSFNPDVDFYSNPTPMPLIEEPRYPSTFASPTSSLRSVSNASSSSLDSLISYGSSDYAPRIERMEPPPSQYYSLEPSAPSSGYSFPAPRPQLAYSVPVSPETSRSPFSSFHSSTRSHPYFCTLDDLSQASSKPLELPPLRVLSSTN